MVVTATPTPDSDSDRPTSAVHISIILRSVTEDEYRQLIEILTGGQDVPITIGPWGDIFKGVLVEVVRKKYVLDRYD